MYVRHFLKCSLLCLWLAKCACVCVYTSLCSKMSYNAVVATRGEVGARTARLRLLTHPRVQAVGGDFGGGDAGGECHEDDLRGAGETRVLELALRGPVFGLCRQGGAPGLLVCTKYAQSMHNVCTMFTQSMQNACTRYAQCVPNGRSAYITCA